MMKLKTLAIIATIGLAANAFAEDTTTSSTTKTKVEKKSSEEVIENKKLKAQLGSKSKYSLSTRINYAGGSIEQVQSHERANLDGSKGTYPTTSLSAKVNGRYRINKKTSITAGTGLSITQPFHTSDETRHGDNYKDKTKVSNINLGFSYVGKLAGITSIYSIDGTYYTSESAHDYQNLASLGADNTLVWSPKKSNLTFLLYTGFSHVFTGGDKYKGNTNAKRTLVKGVTDISGSQEDNFIGAIPMIEYSLNDTFNLRTVFNIWNFTTFGNENGFKLHRYTPTQSIGLGISITRDIFIYPNFQFSWNTVKGSNPSNIAKNLTSFSNVAVSATINLF